jgi:hypothetical protein
MKATMNGVGCCMKIGFLKSRVGRGACNVNDRLQECSLRGWNLDITFKIVFTDEFVVNDVKTSVSAARALVSYINKL